ncbi:VanZ family protein [bacterium]|nr:VanZ family protein [bacterium]
MFQGGSKSFKYFFSRYLFWGLALLWMAVIFAFSNQANSGAYTEAYLQDANVPIRKLAHMFEFAVLALLYQAALVGSLMPQGEAEFETKFKNYWFALALAVLYALADEFHQAFVPGRSASLFDAGVDAAGALIGLTCAYWLRRILVSDAQKKRSQ